MKIIIKLSATLIIILVISINSAYALKTKDKSEYLIDIRGDDGDIYLNRLSIYKELNSTEGEISAFVEGQWNFDTDEWEKLMLGIEVHKLLWKYLYIGQSVQFVSGQILDHMVFNVGNNSADATTKIGLSIPFLKHYFFSIFEEYSSSLEKGRGEYCETMAEINYSPKNSYSIGIGWRHTDRIHNFDSDYADLSLTLHF